MTSATPSSSLTWVHFGDLHMTEGGEQNHRDFLSLIDEVNTHFGSEVDFCFLPGDNANNGSPSQYQLVKSAIDRLKRPVHVIPGDHDLEPGTLDAFYSMLAVDRLPKAGSINGYRCLFLDTVSAGRGGPDFRLAAADLDWLEKEFTRAEAGRERSLVFMHTYPADLKAGRSRLLDLFKRHRVLAVDMGHTHYNELANDGHTIYAATRSTGQIEEGPVGFSVMNVEGDVVSWRFKPLGSSWPLVMVTSPADVRLATHATRSQGIDLRQLLVSARAWSATGIRACRCRLDKGEWRSMQSGEDRSRWAIGCSVNSLPHVLTVEAEDGAGNVGSDSIDLKHSRIGPHAPVGDGSDADTIGPWPAKHIFGTQLGPNRNGRHW
jgi:3',5'-cyclic-AMP phosphodiesterase